MKRTGGIGAAAALCLLVVGTLRAENFPGFSVTPPPPGHWVQVQRNVRSLVWMRRTTIQGLSLGAAVLTQPMNRGFASAREFVDWVKASKTANPDPARFRLISSRVDAGGGEGRASCATYDTVIEDLSGGPGGTLRLQVVGLACLHPVQPTRYFDIQYSARMPSGDSLPEDLREEGRRFVESFRFAAPPADGDWSLGHATSPPGRREAT